MAGSYAENIKVVKLREGLWAAVTESNIIDPDDIDSIRFQKLLIKGIQYFDLEDEVTVEWYLNGDVVSANAADVRLAGDTNELQQAHQFHLDRHPTVDEIKEFYNSVLDEDYVQEADSDVINLLYEYYQDHESIPYRDLYLANLEIDEALTEAKSQASQEKKILQSQKSDFTCGCRNLKLEVLCYDEFEGAAEYIDTFESGGIAIFDQLQQRDNPSKKPFKEYDSFYYYGLWNIIATIISYHNSSGPSEPQNKKDRKKELKDMKDSFNKRYEGLSKWLKNEFDVDLPSLPSELPPLEIGSNGPDFEESSSEEELDEELGPPRYEDISIELDESPEDINLDELTKGDNPNKPLSDLIREERREV
ncbi:MAG: hypothetical protein ABEH81_11070 [Halopenitus sp.]